MARSLNGNFIGRAARLEAQDQRDAQLPPPPDYAAIVVDTFGREFARSIMAGGFETFKAASLWLTRLSDDERESARQLAQVGFDYAQIAAAIESDAMTNQYRETVSTL